MRSGFGRLAQELRSKKGISQTSFAKQMGVSLSRISNIEFQRTSISDRVVGDYLRVLACSGEEAHKLREQARFSEALRKQEDSGDLPPIQAMLEAFGDRISPEALSKIQEIVERDVGKKVSAMMFDSRVKKLSGKRLKSRPSLTPHSFARIVTLASRIRQDNAPETSKLGLEQMLEDAASSEPHFDYRIVEYMPSFSDGAFACIVGDRNGHLLVIEEKRFASMCNGVHFFRHVIAHEFGHHYLHGEMLNSDALTYIAPQELAKNSMSMIGQNQTIEQVIDTLEEEEAECFATFLLVPWEAFMKGTTAYHLSKDYGAQQSSIDRYLPYFKQREVINSICQALWDQGERSHPIFQRGG